VLEDVLKMVKQTVQSKAENKQRDKDKGKTKGREKEKEKDRDRDKDKNGGKEKGKEREKDKEKEIEIEKVKKIIGGTYKSQYVDLDDFAPNEKTGGGTLRLQIPDSDTLERDYDEKEKEIENHDGISNSNNNVNDTFELRRQRSRSINQRFRMESNEKSEDISDIEVSTKTEAQPYALLNRKRGGRVMRRPSAISPRHDPHRSPGVFSYD
jgi:hypothetical protein